MTEFRKRPMFVKSILDRGKKDELYTHLED